MRELEFDGIHDDQEHLVLRDADGETYTLRIDEALRAAVRRDRSTLALIQAQGPLRPKDIQAMLRQGRTAEEIAEAAEIDVDHVRRFEGPVLDERRFVAEGARRFPVGHADSAALEDLVIQRLRSRQADEDTEWDAWKNTDGTWTLQLLFRAGGRERGAQWIVDQQRRSVTAEDDEARWLTLDDDQADPTPTRARLTAVKNAVYDQEADTGRTSRSGRGPRRSAPSHPSRPVHPSHPSSIDEAELEALRQRRGLRPVPSPTSGTWATLEEDEARTTPEEPDTETMPFSPVLPSSPLSPEPTSPGSSSEVTAGEERTEVAGSPDPASPAAEATPTQDQADDEAAFADPEDQDATVQDVEDQQPEEQTPDEHDTEDQDPGTQDTVDLTPLPGFEDTAADAANGTKSSSGPRSSGNKSSGSKSKRASMPSWDEIVFGSKRD
jgi:hypothetical protein